MNVIVVTLQDEGDLVMRVTARHPDGLSNIKLVQYSGVSVPIVEAQPFHAKIDGEHVWVWGVGPFEYGGLYKFHILSDTAKLYFEFEREGPEAPPPEPPRGHPRTQFARTYVLMPPVTNANREENKRIILLVMDTIWDWEHWTTGGGADDAGISPLNDKKVIALRPNDWQDDLEAFFAEHYPGTVYWPLEFDNDYQLRGGLLAYSLKEAGVELSFPVTGEKRITDVFGRWRGTYHHSGLDLAGTHTKGHQVLNAYPGTVIHGGWMKFGFGYTVRVESVAPDGRVFDILYAHLQEGSIEVEIGEEVTVGHVLGAPDNSGNSFGDHLHFQVNLGHERLDPALLLDWESPTPEPEPPEPEPPEPEPPDEPITGRLISLHLQEWRDGVDTFLRTKKPSVVKVFHPQDAVKCHERSPGTMVVLRLYRAEQNLAAGQATRYVTEMKHDLEQANPHIDFVESFNETMPSGNETAIRQSVAFDCEFADVLMATGEPVKPMLLNVAVGNPGFGEVDLLLPAVEKVCRYGGAIGYHGYFAASLELDLLDDYWEHHAGRWQAWDEVFRSQGLYPRYILGEAGACGWDGNWRPGDGWRAHSCYDGDWAWYLQRIREFEQRIAQWNEQHGNRCLGVCLFTTGSPATGWETFQIQESQMRAL